ncbi:MAG: hypothetical protein HY020_19655 [Burkholderiales bacterium]|nr:hypothetical protein [Burkholderiales bacterium]
MRRVQHISFTTMETPPRAPAQPVRSTTAAPQPQDEMWRSRRVQAGSNWMDAWVRKPGSR